MTRPVSVVIPSLDDASLLLRNLEPLVEELDRRALGDEVWVVDDTGRDVLTAPLADAFPTVRVLAHARNLGFAQALKSGIEAAGHELVWSMNPDVRVRSGFLDPLVACLADDDVFAVVPRILLDGDEERVESMTRLVERQGGVRVEQPGLADEHPPYAGYAEPVAFAVGGACLLRRDAFLSTACSPAGGFDPIFEPFYWEDVDLCFTAWRRGQRVLYQPASVVEHHHRGTIGRVIPPELVRAAQEKNRLLFQWKHLEGDARTRAHLAALYRRALDAWLADDRDELVWLALALEQTREALAAREALSDAPLGFREALDATRARGS